MRKERVAYPLVVVFDRYEDSDDFFCFFHQGSYAFIFKNSITFG